MEVRSCVAYARQLECTVITYGATYDGALHSAYILAE
jgi:hypothetical protein